MGECLAFAKRRAWGPVKIELLQQLLREFVIVDINSREVLDRYVELSAASVTGGWNIGDNDLWIAATASATDAFLLTTDTDFDRVEPKFLRRAVIGS